MFFNTQRLIKARRNFQRLALNYIINSVDLKNTIAAFEEIIPFFTQSMYFIGYCFG